MVPFVAGGLENDEFVFVAVRADNLVALRAEFGSSAGAVRWVDTAEWHPHPANRLRAFHELVTREVAEGARNIRLAGEPVWPHGPPEFVREWQRYESVLNHVLRPFPVTLVCLYDAARLDRSLLATARRTHRTVERNGARERAEEFEEPEEFIARWNRELPAPPQWAARMDRVVELSSARRFVAGEALAAGVRPRRAIDLSIAANEVLTNALAYGNGVAGLWAWEESGRFLVQVKDRGGVVADPLAGYRPPTGDAENGRGLWIARQLVDLLQIVSGPSATTVRIHAWIVLN